MKKFTSILAAATFVVALASCGSKTAETTDAMEGAVDSTATEMVEETVAAVDTAVAAVDTAVATATEAVEAAH
jgi:hypothetical protein